MKNILETILEYKKIEVENLKKKYPNGIDFGNSSYNSNYSFIDSLKTSDCIQLIAEIKRGSPSKGLFAPDLDIIDQGTKYEAQGAKAISILTDSKFFYGNYSDIKTLRPIVHLPILFKDFIIDEIQIDIAESLGANIILLIVAAHRIDRLRELLDYANSRNLEVLIEVHNKEELDIALAFDHPLIGINNRNLKTFITDIQVSLDLIKHVNDPSVYLISESGIKSIEDVKKLSKAGFSGILVGETLIKNDVNESLINEISNVRRMFI